VVRDEFVRGLQSRYPCDEALVEVRSVREQRLEVVVDADERPGSSSWNRSAAASSAASSAVRSVTRCSYLSVRTS
jgi:hypothetical protein